MCGLGGCLIGSALGGAPARADDFAQSGDYEPFDLFADTRIFIRARINGTAVLALLDTGAEMTVVDARLASRLGLSVTGSGSAVGTGGTASVSFAEGVKIEAAGLSLSNRTVAIIDLGAVADAMGHPLPLLLGKDLLADQIMDLDLPKRRVAFFPSSRRPDLPGATALAFPQVGPLRAVSLRVVSAPQALFHVDTGSGGALDLYPAFSRTNGLLERRPASTTLTGGVGGLVESPIVSVDAISLGGTTLRNVPAVLSSVGAAATTEPVAGAIGMAVLSRFRLIADFRGETLTILGEDEATGRPFWKNTLGLALRRTATGVVIAHVMPGSPAAQTSLAKGQSILAINEVTADAWTTPALREVMGAPEGQAVVVETAEQGAVRLDARIFY